MELEPCTADDWELVELHAGYLEDQILRQVRDRVDEDTDVAGRCEWRRGGGDLGGRKEGIEEAGREDWEGGNEGR